MHGFGWGLGWCCRTGAKWQCRLYPRRFALRREIGHSTRATGGVGVHIDGQFGSFDGDYEAGRHDFRGENAGHVFDADRIRAH